jgi:hypothetical protein
VEGMMLITELIKNTIRFIFYYCIFVVMGVVGMILKPAVQTLPHPILITYPMEIGLLLIGLVLCNQVKKYLDE